MSTINVRLLCWALFYAFQGVAAQQPSSCTATMRYENHNQVDPKPLKLHALNGTARDEQGIPISRVCVGVFSEKGHKLVAATETGEDGHFALGKIPPGHYRLVAKHEALCAANVPLVVTLPQSRPEKELVLHMYVAGIDKCSYGGLAALRLKSLQLPLHFFRCR